MEVTCRTVSPGPCCALLCLLELRWLLAWSPDASQPLLLERRGLSVAQGQKGGWTAKKKKVFTDRKGEMTEKEKKKICQPRESTVLLGEIHTVMS